MRSCIILIALAAVAHAIPTLSNGIDVSTVARGLEPFDEGPPVIVATKTGIVIEGKTIAAIANGAVDPAEKEGGSLGIKIVRVSNFMKALADLSTKRGKPISGVLLVLDPQTPYRLAVEIVFSIKQAGIRNFALVAKTSAGLGKVAITLPDKQTKPDKAVKPVVSITKDQILLWSISGLEGTLKTPKLTLARGDADKLTPALTDIVKRRFKGKRDAADRQVMVQADGAVPIQWVISAIVAVRTAADGSELFPDVLLSSGFE